MPKPSWTLTVVVGAILGAFAGLVHVFGLGAPYPALLEALTGIAATYGVNVITGSAFRNLFSLPPAVLGFISAGLITVQVAAPFWGISSTAAGVIQGVVTLALALGFGTAVTPAAAKRSQA